MAKYRHPIPSPVVVYRSNAGRAIQVNTAVVGTRGVPLPAHNIIVASKRYRTCKRNGPDSAIIGEFTLQFFLGRNTVFIFIFLFHLQVRQSSVVLFVNFFVCVTALVEYL